MDARTDRAWGDFAGDVAVWIDRAGEQLAAIAHRHGVKVTRHELETALESTIGTIEDKFSIDPRPETATAADARAGIVDMAARIGTRSRSVGADQWRNAGGDTAVDAYLDGMAAGARIDAFAAALKRVAL